MRLIHLTLAYLLVVACEDTYRLGGRSQAVIAESLVAAVKRRDTTAIKAMSAGGRPIELAARIWQADTNVAVFANATGTLQSVWRSPPGGRTVTHFTFQGWQGADTIALEFVKRGGNWLVLDVYFPRER